MWKYNVILVILCFYRRKRKKSTIDITLPDGSSGGSIKRKSSKGKEKEKLAVPKKNLSRCASETK